MSTAVLLKWKDLPKDFPMPKLSRQRLVGEKMMLSRVFLERGCVVPMHSHENEQFACVLQGKLRFDVQDLKTAEKRTIDVTVGEILVLPPNVSHSATAIEDTLVLDVFSPPSQTTGVDVKPRN